MFKTTVNEKSNQILLQDGIFDVDGQEVPIDVQKIGENRYHLLLNHKTYIVELVKGSSKSKVHDIKVNGQLYNVAIADKMDALLEKMGIDTTFEEKTVEVTAPMPGLILDINVAPGDEVQEGDKLLVLEAMKMENIIKCPGPAVIDEIKVAVGDSVENGQTLIRFV
jgi:biotin carboxyl carrier protein